MIPMRDGFHGPSPGIDRFVEQHVRSTRRELNANWSVPLRGVRFEINGRLGPVFIVIARCVVMPNGSSFATNASVRSDEFRIVTGRELIKEYESSPGNLRAFCSKCGAPLYGTFADIPSIGRVRL
jgi:Glutathione-dependent formaldehyde-activating enzyme